jgi:hypothetical protein
MREIVFATLCLVLLAGCGLQPQGSAPAVSEEVSDVAAETQAPLPTYTPAPTYTPLPTYTPYPTAPPRPTATETPVPSPTSYPTNTRYPTNTPPPQPGSRTLPVALGTTGIAVMESEGVRLEITITNVVSGDEAWSMIREANMYNDPPPEGMEYVLFYTSLTIVEGPDDETQSFSGYSWNLVRPDGKVEELMDSAWIVEPEPIFDGSGFPGATIEGWSAFARPPGEEVVLVFGMGYGGRGGVWFALQ